MDRPFRALEPAAREIGRAMVNDRDAPTQIGGHVHQGNRIQAGTEQQQLGNGLQARVEHAEPGLILPVMRLSRAHDAFALLRELVREGLIDIPRLA